MIKDVVYDPIFWAGESKKATKDDLQVAQDLLDMLIANKDSCVGMAANMIGVRKRIIVFDNGNGIFLCLAVRVNANVIQPLKFNGKSPNSKPASKPLPAGPHR